MRSGTICGSSDGGSGNYVRVWSRGGGIATRLHRCTHALQGSVNHVVDRICGGTGELLLSIVHHRCCCSLIRVAICDAVGDRTGKLGGLILNVVDRRVGILADGILRLLILCGHRILKRLSSLAVSVRYAFFDISLRLLGVALQLPHDLLRDVRWRRVRLLLSADEVSDRVLNCLDRILSVLIELIACGKLPIACLPSVHLSRVYTHRRHCTIYSRGDVVLTSTQRVSGVGQCIVRCVLESLSVALSCIRGSGGRVVHSIRC